MKKLITVLMLCLFVGGCATSFQKSMEEAFIDCQNTCKNVEADQMNIICFQKEGKKYESICICKGK
jgi:outer membrane lipoprotein-sorting protein